MLHDARQVTEPDVDIFDLLVLGKFEDVVGRLFRHRMLLYCIRGRRYGADIARQSTRVAQTLLTVPPTTDAGSPRPYCGAMVGKIVTGGMPNGNLVIGSAR
ncbi:glutamine synthetase [Mycobacterium tuberculosis]|nr:glutamine synthetase [Mycobacterium tuberculosis]